MTPHRSFNERIYTDEDAIAEGSGFAILRDSEEVLKVAKLLSKPAATDRSNMMEGPTEEGRWPLHSLHNLATQLDGQTGDLLDQVGDEDLEAIGASLVLLERKVKEARTELSEIPTITDVTDTTDPPG